MFGYLFRRKYNVHPWELLFLIIHPMPASWIRLCERERERESDWERGDSCFVESAAAVWFISAVRFGSRAWIRFVHATLLKACQCCYQSGTVNPCSRECDSSKSPARHRSIIILSGDEGRRRRCRRIIIRQSRSATIAAWSLLKDSGPPRICKVWQIKGYNVVNRSSDRLRS